MSASEAERRASEAEISGKKGEFCVPEARRSVSEGGRQVSEGEAGDVNLPVGEDFDAPHAEDYAAADEPARA